jgi:hypothetical protein
MMTSGLADFNFKVQKYDKAGKNIIHRNCLLTVQEAADDGISSASCDTILMEGKGMQ